MDALELQSSQEPPNAGQSAAGRSARTGGLNLAVPLTVKGIAAV